MGPFLTGFAHELVKVGAFKYDTDQNIRPDFAKSVASTAKKLQPPQPTKGPKTQIPVTPTADRTHAINPLTSPNALIEQKA